MVAKGQIFFMKEFKIIYVNTLSGRWSLIPLSLSVDRTSREQVMETDPL